MRETEQQWESFHLFYHQSFEQPLVGFVLPTIRALARADLIERFFFVRYGLGGPHIRLRIQARLGNSAAVVELVQEAARDFLASTPSTKSLDEEIIRQGNERLLRLDPHETDAAVYPDNSLRTVPFRPEEKRYGGPLLLRYSLDMFTISSVVALDFAARSVNEPRSRQLVHAFCLLVQQALAFSADQDELEILLGYGVDSWGDAFPKIVEKGDRVFAEQQDLLLHLFRAELTASPTSLSRPTSTSLLGEGALRLSAAAAGCDPSVRGRIGTSQLHVTANRLGMLNPEEVYLSRLLTNASRVVGSEAPWSRTAGQELSAERGPLMTDILSRALALLL